MPRRTLVAPPRLRDKLQAPAPAIPRGRLHSRNLGKRDLRCNTGQEIAQSKDVTFDFSFVEAAEGACVNEKKRSEEQKKPDTVRKTSPGRLRPELDFSTHTPTQSAKHGGEQT